MKAEEMSEQNNVRPELSFIASRRFFQKNRKSWLKDHYGKFVVIKENELIGIYEECRQARIAASEDRGEWYFYVVSEEEERKEYKESNVSTWDCLTEPFVDTWLPEEIYKYNQILKVRGFPKPVIKFLRYILCTGLFWNFLWMDWTELSISDFFYGWATNLVFLSIVISPLVGIAKHNWISGLLTLLVFISPMLVFIAIGATRMILDPDKKNDPVLEEMTMVNVLEILSSNAVQQIAWLKHFQADISIDELALVFDDFMICADGFLDMGKLTQKQYDALKTLDKKLDAVSGEENAHIWTEEALKHSNDWKEIRHLAEIALQLIGENHCAYTDFKLFFSFVRGNK